MGKLKMFGALLSAAMLAVSVPMTAFAASDRAAAEQISTTGWVEVSNAHPHKGDVISMAISLNGSSQVNGNAIKGISGMMTSIEGARPALGPESTAAPSTAPTTAPTAVPTSATTPTPTAAETPSASATDEPTETPSASATDEPTETPSASATDEPTETPSASATDEPTETPSESASDEPSETPSESASDEPSEAPSASSSDEPTEAPSEDSSTEPDASAPSDEDADQSEENEGADRDSDDGWEGLLSEENLFIVLGDAPETNKAVRYFQITGEPGSTVTFQFKGRYSDGKADHEFVATHEFTVASGETTVTRSVDMGAQGRISTTTDSKLNFRVWPTFTTIEGVQAAAMNGRGTSPGEILRNLSMSKGTVARVYNGSSNKPRLSAVATGDTIRFTGSGRAAASEAIVVVKGDLLGTGKLGLNQLVAMSKTLAGQLPMSEAALQAADVNGDGSVTSADATALKKLVLNRK